MPHQLPLGFRPNPTDVQLIIYLLIWVSGGTAQLPVPLPLTDAVIKPLDVYCCTEAQIQEAINGSGGEMFALVKRRKASWGNKYDRSAVGGSWKHKLRKHILDKNGLPIGCKRSMCFKRAHDDGRYKTNLLMDEFECASKFPENENEWVICRIKKSKENKNKSPEQIHGNSVAQVHTDYEPNQLLTYLVKNYCSYYRAGESSNQVNMYPANNFPSTNQDMQQENSDHVIDQRPLDINSAENIGLYDDEEYDVGRYNNEEYDVSRYNQGNMPSNSLQPFPYQEVGESSNQENMRYNSLQPFPYQEVGESSSQENMRYNSLQPFAPSQFNEPESSNQDMLQYNSDHVNDQPLWDYIESEDNFGLGNYYMKIFDRTNTT